MSHIALKKQEEQNEQKLKELLRRPENKKCFDCPVKSPFFVNVSIQTFVCARCSGLVREVGHRVKSISASKFSGPELLSLELGGNEVAKSIWLSTYHSTSSEPETDSDVRYFMRQKYYEQKWLDRKKAIDHAERVKMAIKQAYSADGSPIKKTSVSQNERKQSVELSRPKMYSSQSSWMDDNTPIGLISTVKSQTNNNKNQDLLLDDDIIPSPKSPTPGFGIPFQSNNNNGTSALPPIQFGSPKNTPVKKPTPTNDIYADLVGLDPTPAVRKASYTGGVLQPNSPTTTTTTTASNNYMTSPILPQQPLKVNTTTSIPTPTPSTNSTPSSNKWSDPYAALRGLSLNDSPSTYSSITNNNNVTRQTNGNTTYQGFQTSASPTSASSFTKSSLFSDLDPLSKR